MKRMNKNKTNYVISKEVVYDHQHIKPGEKVEKINEWKENTEGEAIAWFLTQKGGEIPLFKDEVVEE